MSYYVDRATGAVAVSDKAPDGYVEATRADYDAAIAAGRASVETWLAERRDDADARAAERAAQSVTDRAALVAAGIPAETAERLTGAS